MTLADSATPMRARSLSLILLVSACGGVPAQPTTPVAPPPSPQADRSAPPPSSSPCGDHHGMSIEGQLGTIAGGNVRRVMRDAEATLMACYTNRVEALPVLAGRIELRLRVGDGGAVRWAIPARSTLGDRATERCMVEAASALRFDAPCGGEAEVTYALEMDGGPDRRPATAWGAQRVEAALRARRTALATCRRNDHSPLQVTLYVAPNGSVAAAGAALSSSEATAMTDCVLREVQALRLPTPGSWYARTTVTIP